VINLLENACKFTPANGQIELGARMNGEAMIVWVKDSGPGIPPEEHEHIFQKFIRLRAEGSPKGLGLGLFFCRLAVNAHGGQIWVESQPPHGSQFNFSLPVANHPLDVQSS
jgi:signal transduction histidine kinase